MAAERTRVVCDELRAGLAAYGTPEQILTGIQSGWAALGLSRGRQEGSVPSGTRLSSLLDRLERLATCCLLTMLAGGATAGSRDALLGTRRPDR
jgi:hypothetical protein